MNLNRNDILNISIENNIKSINELLNYIDFKEYTELVAKKNDQLKKRYKYGYKERLLYKYKIELYNNMIKEGKILNKRKCMGYCNNWTFEYKMNNEWR